MSDQLRPSNTIQTGLAVAASQQPMEEEASIDEQIRVASLYTPIHVQYEFLHDVNLKHYIYNMHVIYI